MSAYGFVWAGEGDLADALKGAGLEPFKGAEKFFLFPEDLSASRRTKAWDASVGLGFVAGPVVKAKAGRLIFKSEEARVSSGVVYQPDVADAHNEFVTREELLKAMVDYTAGASKAIRRQHQPGTDIGAVIGTVVWPWDAEVPQRKESLRAGTSFAIVRWSEVGWALVKAGKVNGLSMGGYARVRPAAA